MYGPKLFGEDKTFRWVRLVPPRPDEVELAWELLQHPSLHPQLMVGDPKPLEVYRELVRKQAEARDRIAWWIETENDAGQLQFAGLRGVFAIGEREVFRSGKTYNAYGGQIFGAVHPDFRGRGIAIRSMAMAITHLFGIQGHDVVYTEVLQCNPISEHIVRKMGFQEVGVVLEGSPEAYEEGGQRYGFTRFDLTPNEFRFG